MLVSFLAHSPIFLGAGKKIEILDNILKQQMNHSALERNMKI